MKRSPSRSRWLRMETLFSLIFVIVAFFLLNAFQLEQAAPRAASPKADTAIPSTFFAMTTVNSSDYPVPPIGFLGHPSTFAWAWIEQQKDQYTWSGFDAFVSDAQSHGVPIAITIALTPQWAAADPKSCHPLAGGSLEGCTSPPSNYQYWSDFITNLVTHYKGEVQYYELWNEANGSTYWTGTIQDMAHMAYVAYPIIKHIDPNALVITPSVTGPVGNVIKNSATTWMTTYLQTSYMGKTGSQLADAGSFHGYIAQTGVRPYPWPEQDSTPGCTPFKTCYGSIITKTTQMEAVFNKYMPGKPVFDTEGSWGDMNITNAKDQAAWLARWYILQANHNVQVVSWYTWGINKSGQQTWGDIENADGTPNEAGIAYGQVYAWLVGASFTSSCAADQNMTWTCTITRAGGYQGEMVWNAVGSRQFTPASKYKQYQDLQGNIVPIHGSVTIGSLPILLETGNIP